MRIATRPPIALPYAREADLGAETATLAVAQIRQQVARAMSAQERLAPRRLLELLLN